MYCTRKRQRVSIRDESGRIVTSDFCGRPLIFGSGKADSMGILKTEAVYSGGSTAQLVGSMELALPVVPKMLKFNRLRLRAAKGFQIGPVVLALSSAGMCTVFLARMPSAVTLVTVVLGNSGGIFLGDLPPHEAFPLGGTNSVRGYDEGELGSSRKFVMASSELQVPLMAPLEGVIFADYGSDLHSANEGESSSISAYIQLDSAFFFPFFG